MTRFVLVGYLPPHRNQISNQLRRMYHRQYDLLKEELQSIDYIGLTLDFWSSRSLISYLCITGHWYNDKVEYISKIIHFSSFNERHTAINIAHCIKESLNGLGIYHKVISITCDGGENVVAACLKLDGRIKRIWCSAHRLHLVIINALGFWNKQKKANTNESIDKWQEVSVTTNDVTAKEQEDCIPVNASNLSKSDDSLFDQAYNGMDAHDVVMVDANDSEKEMELEDEPNSEDDDDSDTEGQDLNLICDNWSTTIDTNVPAADVVELIINVLKKCRSIATISRKSSIISNFLRSVSSNKTNRKISNDCKSRWNSTSMLIESIITMKHLLMKLFLEKRSLKLRKEQLDKLSAIELDNNDWDFLVSLNRVLNPFALATVMMSGKNYPSIGLTYHAIQKLKHFCEVDDGGNEHVNAFKKLLLSKICKYFYQDEEQVDHFQKHAFFDPVAHLSLNDNEKTQCEKYIKNLILGDIYPQRASQLDSTQTSLPTNTIPSSSTTQSQVHQSVPQSALLKRSTYDDFIAACGQDHFERETTREKSKRVGLIEELKYFRAAVQDFNAKRKPSTTAAVEFWKSHHI
ncbi:unnamed protein product, partial [Adineta ricciae]